MVYQTYDGGTETPPDEAFANFSQEVVASLSALHGFADRDSGDPERYGPYNEMMSNKGLLFGRTWVTQTDERDNDMSYYDNNGLINRNFTDDDPVKNFWIDQVSVSFETIDMSEVVGTLLGYQLRVIDYWHFVSGKSPEYRGKAIIVARIYENDGKAFNHPLYDNLASGTIKKDRQGRPHKYVFEPIGFSNIVAGDHWLNVFVRLSQNYMACVYRNQKQSRDETLWDTDDTQSKLIESGLYQLTNDFFIDESKDVKKETRKVITSKGKTRETNRIHQDIDEELSIAELMEQDFS